MSGQTLSKAKNAAKFVVFMVGFYGLLFACSLPYSYFLGREQGASCTMGNQCTQGHWFGQCVRGDGPNYCAARCDHDRPCPNGWRCGTPPHLSDTYCVRS